MLAAWEKHRGESYVPLYAPGRCIIGARIVTGALQRLGIEAETIAVQFTAVGPEGEVGFDRGLLGIGDIWCGHCVVWLPEHRQVIDPTTDGSSEYVGAALKPVTFYAPEGWEAGRFPIVFGSDSLGLRYRAAPEETGFRETANWTWQPGIAAQLSERLAEAIAGEMVGSEVGAT